MSLFSVLYLTGATYIYANSAASTKIRPCTSWLLLFMGFTYTHYVEYPM